MSAPTASAEATSVWFPHARRVELRRELLPPVGAHDVRVQALVSALSHGTEMLVYRGQVPPEVELDLPTLDGSFGFPIKYGYASVGRVVEVGAEVSELAVNDLVFTLHPHQSAYVVPANLPVRLPSESEPEHGVFVANLETAVNVTLDAAPRLGERVVVFGQGVVGLLVGQLLRRAGARRVIVADPFQRRRALAQRLGVDTALEPTPDVPARIRDLTGGVGADLAVEASGNGAALAQAIDSLAFGGTVVVCSWYGTKPVLVPLGGAFHRRRLRLVSSQVGTIDAVLQPRWTRARRLELALSLLRKLDLGQLVSHRFPVAQAAAAYRLVDEHPEQTVQVMLTYP
ncbi:MAG TPA: zinc-binding alcohol dehydrogenase [Chloroflexota bacterium]|nr:zinc-binding alcohol dehydrogenase [Chloroflexota bacterium]